MKVTAIPRGARARQATPAAARRARGELVERLRVRRGEIEAAVCARVYSIADPGETADPAYAEGLRGAVSAALDYGLESLEASEERAPDVPVALIAQARLAARNGVGIDVVLRRYSGGYTLLGDFLVQEAAKLDLSSSALERALHAQATALDRLLAVVSEEHAREARSPPASAERRRLRLVQSLLAGEPVDPAELQYPFQGSHLGLVCFGPRPDETARELAAALGRSLLAVRPSPDTVWAWLGGGRPLDPSEPLEIARAGEWAEAIAIGEPAEALAGWRLTHRQAAAALPVAVRDERRAVRYIDVALLASALGDDLATAALTQFYLEPLRRARDGGNVALETLRAYFDADRNVSSAAAMLGVKRTTAGSRLRAIEAAIGRPLSACAAELEVVLRLRDSAG